MTYNPTAEARNLNVWKVTIAACLVFSSVRITTALLSPVTYLMMQDYIVAVPGFTLTAIGIFYFYIRRDRWLSEACLGIGIPILCQVCACEFGNIPFYLGSQYPLQDAALASTDSSLGFCWPCVVSWFNQHYMLNNLSSYFYNSILVQPVILAGIAIWRRDIPRLCTYFVAYNIAYMITNIVAYRFPALGVYEHFRLSIADHQNITMVFTNEMTAPINALRAGYLPRGFTEQQILISFPSFHAVLACLFTWFAWSSRLRWLFVAANAIMLMSTPVQGGHYLTDIVAGLAVGVFAIAAAAAFIKKISGKKDNSATITDMTLSVPFVIPALAYPAPSTSGEARLP